jgi:hypothetical protein
VGVYLISTPEFQLNFSESQRQRDGKDYIVGAQTTHTSTPMRQQSQKGLLNICDEIKVDGVGYYAGNAETFVSDNVSRRDEAVPYKSSMNYDTHFDFIVNMLCNNDVGSGEDKRRNYVNLEAICRHRRLK